MGMQGRVVAERLDSLCDVCGLFPPPVRGLPSNHRRRSANASARPLPWLQRSAGLLHAGRAQELAEASEA